MSPQLAVCCYFGGFLLHFFPFDSPNHFWNGWDAQMIDLSPCNENLQFPPTGEEEMSGNDEELKTAQEQSLPHLSTPDPAWGVRLPQEVFAALAGANAVGISPHFSPP
ncbi:hypothetical protein KC19_VG330500 [Ceratodon purpureus]|uniref:Uncharacterized protein n=1 Tax=Ceratodon purpureus TaxID=3225 RepID=A0A8T0HXQ6_CERPU|nr:hypothetical protein KC19_VG330500 [Ceratodon purpureus]